MWEIILLVWPLVIALVSGLSLWKFYPIADDCVIKAPRRNSITFQSPPLCKSSLLCPSTCRACCGMGSNLVQPCSHAAMQPCSWAVCKWLREARSSLSSPWPALNLQLLLLVLPELGGRIFLSLPLLHSWPWPPPQPSFCSPLSPYPCQPILQLWPCSALPAQEPWKQSPSWWGPCADGNAVTLGSQLPLSSSFLTSMLTSSQNFDSFHFLPGLILLNIPWAIFFYFRSDILWDNGTTCWCIKSR